VRLWKATQAYAARVTVAAGEVRAVSWSELQAVPSPAVAGKGPAEREPDELSGLTPEAQVEYLSKFFTVGDQLVVAATQNHVSVSTDFVVHQGRYHKQVDEDAFFVEVGRSDLAEQYRSRRATRRGLVGAGLAVGAAGLVYGLASAITSDSSCNVPPGDPSFAERCVDGPGRRLQQGVTVALVGGALGSGLILGGALVKPHPVEVDEVRRLADEYNVALRRRLAAPPAPPAPRDTQLTLYVAPGAGPTLLGISFGVLF